LFDLHQSNPFGPNSLPALDSTPHPSVLCILGLIHFGLAKDGHDSALIYTKAHDVHYVAPPPPGLGGPHHHHHPHYSSPEHHAPFTKDPFFNFGFHHARFTDGFEMDIIPDMSAIWRDFDKIQKKAAIKGWKAKFVRRRYAFGKSYVV